jgi:thiamine transport system substrate-binding protein
MRLVTIPAITIPAMLAAGGAAAQERPVLTVYTYDSFASEWGPGPAMEPLFEAECGCDLRLVAVGDGAALLSRLRLEGDRTQADVIVGLDTNLTAAAADTNLFAPHGLNPELTLPVDWEDDLFLPFDWGWFAFVHREETDAPESFETLAASDASILIQDPRSSTPGLGLALWVQAAYGDRAEEIWAGLSDNIVTVTPGWSEAYGLFVEGEADMVLSYSTSPAYHLIAEDDPGFAAAAFEEGHLLQIEVAAKVASTEEPELADAFLRFLVSEPAQAIIPETNWMYPAALSREKLPEGFRTLIEPETSLLLAPGEAAAMADAAIDAWRTALSR